MLYDLFLAWRHLRARPLHTVITLLIVALAVGLPVSVLALGAGARAGIIRASDPFGVLVIGAKGSSQQLVLSTLLLQGVPVGNIPIDIYEQLRADARVSLAVPIALGDNVGGARIIGTSAGLLELRSEQNAPPAFRLADGQFFEADFEAVLGSRAAAALGLGVGDSFLAEHGVERGLEADQHEQPYTVVGVFAPSGGPYDSAVFTSIETVHGAHADLEESPFAVEAAPVEEQITAVLARPVGFVEANQLWQTFFSGSQAQAAFPGQELGALFDLFSLGERVLTNVGYLVLAMGALTVFLSMYSATTAREQSIAVMRSVGSTRASVFRIVMFETLGIMLLGAAAGRLIGYAAAWGLAEALTLQSTIPIPIRFLPQIEPLLWLLTLGFGLLAGLLPALRAYSVNIIEKMFQS
jgi:putative ABC transport system permease protein